MKLSEIKNQLNNISKVNFLLPNGTLVPEHFHVTEVGLITKNFIDCGGTVRNETVANFQLWESSDFDHRIAPQKLLKILALSEKILGKEDLEIEVEYQTETIGKYSLDFNGENFVLKTKHTNCLASDNCGASAEKSTLKLVELGTQEACCSPGGGCC